MNNRDHDRKPPAPGDDALELLGVRIDSISMAGVIRTVEEMVGGNGRHYILPVNPEMIMLARKNTQFREVLNRSSLTLPDGIGVLLASRLFRHRLQNRVTGVDTFLHISETASRHAWRIFLLGAAQGVAEEVKTRLERQFPGIQVVGTYSGSPHPDEEETICSLVSSANPHILFVAYGAPKQELWVARNLTRLNVPVVICVGGTFDFIAGVTKRAPERMRNLGLEWLYRLLQEPWRWRRMLALPRFAVAVIVHRFFNH